MRVPIATLNGTCDYRHNRLVDVVALDIRSAICCQGAGMHAVRMAPTPTTIGKFACNDRSCLCNALACLAFVFRSCSTRREKMGRDGAGTSLCCPPSHIRSVFPSAI